MAQVRLRGEGDSRSRLRAVTKLYWLNMLLLRAAVDFYSVCFWKDIAMDPSFFACTSCGGGSSLTRETQTIFSPNRFPRGNPKALLGQQRDVNFLGQNHLLHGHASNGSYPDQIPEQVSWLIIIQRSTALLWAPLECLTLPLRLNAATQWRKFPVEVGIHNLVLAVLTHTIGKGWNVDWLVNIQKKESQVVQLSSVLHHMRTLRVSGADLHHRCFILTCELFR